MSEFKCPIESCGRVLQSGKVLKEHLRRRHNIQPGNGAQEEQVIQQEISKLPKIKTLKMQIPQHRLPDIHRRSSSKGKIQSSSINTSKITSVISESRTIIGASQNLVKTKRPSLGKRMNNSNVQRNDKLPELKALAKPKKLEILNESKLKKSQSQQGEQNVMYSTAPDFKKLLKESLNRQRSGSKQKKQPNAASGQNSSKIAQNELLLVKTQQGFHQKEVRMHKTLKRPSRDRNMDSQSVIIELKKAQTQQKQVIHTKLEKLVQNEVKPNEIKNDPRLKNRRQISLRKGQSKQQASAAQYNFQQRIVVFDAGVGPKLSIPPQAKVQFIYANNCKLSHISLGGIEFLREISLQHNLLKDLSFLNYSNSNIQKLFIDHNQLTSVDYLPPSLKIFSASFNSISDLDIVSRQLSRNIAMTEIDFSFNPVRKESNYKLHILSSCPRLKKIDGMKITKFDLELATEYSRMLDEELGLIPSSKGKDLIISRCSQSPSTVPSSVEEVEPDQIGHEELLKEISKLQKAVKHTKDHLGILRKQNEIIQGEISALNGNQQSSEGDFTTLYNKLRKECEALELLNFLQYADEEELVSLIAKKKIELCVE